MKQNAQCLCALHCLKPPKEVPKTTSEEELKTKQEAPEKFITIIIIIIIITVTLYISVEIIGLQSHTSAYLQGLLPQNSQVFIHS